MEILAGLIIVGGIIFLTALFNMFVLSKLWVWFVTPAFGVPCPRLYILYGLVLTIAFFSNSTKRGEEQSYGDVIAGSLAKGIAILLVGWAVQAMFA